MFHLCATNYHLVQLLLIDLESIGFEFGVGFWGGIGTSIFAIRIIVVGWVGNIQA
jgi:hypothetical protein